MAFIQIHKAPNLQIAVLAIEREEDYYLKKMQLDDTQSHEFKSLHHSHRLEWLASRWLLCEMVEISAPPYQKDEFGKPQFKDQMAPRIPISTLLSPLEYLDADYAIFQSELSNSSSELSILNSQLSISHTTGFAAAIISDVLVGIDIQGFEEKTLRIRSKFISAQDLAHYEHSPYFGDIVHIFWGAKESMYKAWGKRGLDFREHLFLDNFEFDPAGGECRGELRKEGIKMKFMIGYQIVNKQYLVWVEKLP